MVEQGFRHMIKIFSDFIEDAALEQFYDAMQQDFVVKGALMPDAHKGYTLPIGSAIATDNFVLPSWVGYDIGCGMCAVKLIGVTVDDIKDNAQAIFDGIYEAVPVGFKSFEKVQNCTINLSYTEVIGSLIRKGAYRQIGTLGGGNHFIEIGADEKSNVWIVIHSGSRGLGHKVAGHYMTLASANRPKLEAEFDENNTQLLKYNPTSYEAIKKKLVNKKLIKAAKPKEGHYGFAADSEDGKNYIKDALFAQEFALENRKAMMRSVMNVIDNIVGVNTLAGQFINRNHNHIVSREIDGKDCFIHRKGATHAECDMLGVIPGNMRDGSFIVRGLGNSESLFSSSHGAGRVLGRRAAKEQLDVKVFEEQLKDVTALVGLGTLDESPDAYKNIFEVMKLQADLVEVVAWVKPLINIKG